MASALDRRDYSSITSLSQAVTMRCPGDAPVEERCVAERTSDVSGATRILGGKMIAFIPVDDFVAATESDLETLTGRAGVVSVGCGSITRNGGGKGSCVTRVTLALGDSDNRSDAPVLLLFFVAGGSDWVLTGSGGWYANDPVINGGPLGGIWIAGSEEKEIWFNPLR